MRNHPHQVIHVDQFVTANHDRVARKDFYHRMALRIAVAKQKGQALRKVAEPSRAAS